MAMGKVGLCKYHKIVWVGRATTERGSLVLTFLP